MAESSIIAECSILQQTLQFRKFLSWQRVSVMADCSILEQTLPLRKVLSWQRVPLWQTVVS